MLLTWDYDHTSRSRIGGPCRAAPGLVAARGNYHAPAARPGLAGNRHSRSLHCHRPDQQALRLARSYLITNETGVTGKSFDDFGAGAAKIDFRHSDPGLRSRTAPDLCQPAAAEVDCRQWPEPALREGCGPDAGRALAARHDVSADELKPGGNQIVISGGGLYVDTSSHAAKAGEASTAARPSSPTHWDPRASGPASISCGSACTGTRPVATVTTRRHRPGGRAPRPANPPAGHAPQGHALGR